MKKVHYKTAHGLGSQKSGQAIFNKNHFAGLATYPAEIQEKITSWGLTRVAGNAFICTSDRNFWAVKDGKIMKLVSGEVDDGDKIAPAPEDHPEQYLAGILEDLSF